MSHVQHCLQMIICIIKQSIMEMILPIMVIQMTILNTPKLMAFF